MYKQIFAYDMDDKLKSLDTFLVNNVYGAIILDTRRAKKTGDYPVRYRLTYQRRQIYVNAGFDLSADEWQSMPGTRKTYLIETKKVIKAGFSRLEQAVRDICRNGEYSHEKLTTFIKRGRKQGISASFDARITELEINGQIGTAGIYRTAKTYIDKYDHSLTFSEITPRWLQKFEQYAIKDGLTYSTLGIYLRCLRALFNEAIQNRIIKESDYPFARSEGDKIKYRIKEGTGTKIALSPQQIGKIATYTPPTKAMTRSRDLFLLSFLLGGINFKDMLLLKWDHIRGDEIVYIREKTKNSNRKSVEIRIPLTDPVKALFDTIGNDQGEYILPYMMHNPSPADVRRITQNITRAVNRHLLEMGKDMNIDGLSTMVARHSFATILKNSGVPIAFISETLGHRSLTTTANYLKGFEKEQRSKHFDVITKIGK